MSARTFSLRADICARHSRVPKKRQGGSGGLGRIALICAPPASAVPQGRDSTVRARDRSKAVRGTKDLSVSAILRSPVQYLRTVLQHHAIFLLCAMAAPFDGGMQTYCLQFRTPGKAGGEVDSQQVGHSDHQIGALRALVHRILGLPGVVDLEQAHCREKRKYDLDLNQVVRVQCREGRGRVGGVWGPGT